MSNKSEAYFAPELPTPTPLDQGGFPLTVEEIMTHDVVTVTPRQTLADAMVLMSMHRFRHLLVTNAEGKLLGVLSDRDLLSALPAKPDWDSHEISQMMTKNPVTVRPDAALAGAVSEMLSGRFNSLPVVAEDGTVVGVLTSTDLLRHYQRMVQAMQSKLQEIGFIEFSLG